MGRKASIVTGMALLGALAGWLYRQNRNLHPEAKEVSRWEDEGGQVAQPAPQRGATPANASHVVEQDDPAVWQFPKS